MKIKKILLVALPVAVLIAGAVYTVYLRPEKKNVVSLPTDREMASDLQEKGMALAKKKYFAPLIASYEQIVAIAPDSMDARKKLALAYFEAGEREKARPLLEKIVRSPLADAECWYELAQIEFTDGDIRSATDHVQKALALDPQHAAAMTLRKQLP